MPTTYAHWRFGCDCIETLPDNLKKAVHNNRELFDLGVHGPDIFFYDLAFPKVTKYGGDMHHNPSREFFENAIQVYKDNDEDKDAMMSYILGFASHFTLDSQCHGYIDRKKEVSGVSHNKIEAEYDGHLMKTDGKSVALTDRAQSLRPDKETARIMARFFPFDESIIYRTTKMQQILISALVCKSDFKRNFFYNLLDKINMKDFRDLIVMPEEMEECKDSNMRIDKLKDNALIVYEDVYSAIIDSIENGTQLPAYFDHDFGPWADYQDIPVLDVSEEINYVPELRK